MVRDLDPTRPLGREIRRVVRHRARRAAAVLQAAIGEPEVPGATAEIADVATAVHTARRRCKEIRALLRLVTDLDAGPARLLDRAVGDAARSLAPVRDADVAAAITARFAGADGAPDPPLPEREVRAAFAAANAHLAQALEIVPRVRFADDAGSLRRGLRGTYRRSRRAYERALKDPTPRRLHRWRTWNKRLWYQVRFLAVTAPSVLEPLARLLDLAGEALGDLHDLDVFLASERGAELEEAHLATLRAERADLCSRALRWGATIHAEPASAFAERLVRLWECAAAQGPEPPM